MITAPTRTKSIHLTLKDRENFNKRGFIVKEIINFNQFFHICFLNTAIFGMFLLPATLAWHFLPGPLFLIGAIGIIIIPIKLIFGASIRYIFMGKFFYVSQGSFIAFKKVYNKGSSPYMHVKKILWGERLFKKIDTLLFGEYQKDLYGASAYLSMCITFTGSGIIIYNYSPLFSGLLFIFVIFMILCYPVIISIFHILIEYLHPLYAFGNLGEKIQKLTPEIESQSQLIQTEFQKDMNFGVLHSGFEKLSSTFSAIVSLVLKLERIEARANKGNLFDSAKYIGSLRSDIVTPLTELRKFLEKQRTELLRSQKELMKVRIGGVDSEINSEGREHSGGQEQAELGSKRSESLLQELSTNIAALDTMVGKMG